jgi:hypothetical protein
VDRKEAVYGSHRNMPLGKIPDQSAGLPEGMDTLSVSFGKKTPKCLELGEVVMPRIPRHEVEEKARERRDLYKKVTQFVRFMRMTMMGCGFCRVTMIGMWGR